MSQVPIKPTQNFYFQIILVKLISSNNQQFEGILLKFSINRGKQTFDETKNLPFQIIENYIPLNRTRLNFIIFTYDHQKMYEFSLKLYEIIEDEQKCIGQFILDSNAYVNQFLNNNKAAFKEQIIFNNGVNAEIQLYIERSRYYLEKLIREINNPKSKIMQQGNSPKFHRIQDNKSRAKDPSVSPRRQRQNLFKKTSPKKERIQLAHQPIVSQQKQHKVIQIDEPHKLEVQQLQQINKVYTNPTVEEQIKIDNEKIENQNYIQLLMQAQKHQQGLEQQLVVCQQKKPQEIQVEQTKWQLLQQLKPIQSPTILQNQITTPISLQLDLTNKQELPQQIPQQKIPQQIKQQKIEQQKMEQVQTEQIKKQPTQQIKAQSVQQILQVLPQSQFQEIKQFQIIQQEEHNKDFSFQKQESSIQFRRPIFQTEHLNDSAQMSTRTQFSYQFKIGFLVFLFFILVASTFIQQEQQSFPPSPSSQKIKNEIVPPKKVKSNKPKKGLKKAVQPVVSKNKK